MTHEKHDNRPILSALYVGLLLTGAAMVAPLVDHVTGNKLAAHIRDGYPDYSDAAIVAAANTYLVILTVVGIAGIACWLLTIWAVRAGKRWSMWAAGGIFTVGAIIALTGLLTDDTSGQSGLPTLFGWIGVLPSIAGAAAVALLAAQRHGAVSSIGRFYRSS